MHPVAGKSKKKDLLKKMGFDAIIIDEAHQGSSTDKTKTEILDVDNDVEEIRKNIKLNILFYKIKIDIICLFNQ